MSVSKIRLRPGINTQLTRTQNETGYSDGNLMRARDSLMECIGGWVSFIASPFVNGRVSALHAWSNLAKTALLVIGGVDRAILDTGGALTDITPGTITTVTAQLSTVNGSAIVTITDAAAPLLGGSWLRINATATVGGLSIGVGMVQGYVKLLTGNGAVGTFAWPSAATSTATGGGVVTTQYSINLPKTASTYWSFDNWGENLILCPQNGSIYVYFGVGTPGAVQPFGVGGDQPLATSGILVGMPERHLIAMGSAPPSSAVMDPMLVAWCDTENYTVWTATAFNAAGSFRIAAGSRIIAWRRTAAQILIWTDISLVGMQYVGTPYIYGFNEIGTACGIIGPKAAVTVGNSAFWMSALAFWTYSGVAIPIPCDVRDRVFGNLNVALGALVCAALNGQYNEVTWYYPSLTATENDSYATYNYVDKTWVCGTLARTAWLDASVIGAPVGAAPGGVVYQHETGLTADGAAIPNSLTTGFFDIGDGEDFSFLDQIIMDFAKQVGSINVTIQSQQYPNGPTTTKGPFAVSPSKPFISPRIRGRQIALKFDSIGVGTFWRLGALRVRVAGDGRR